MSTKYFSVVEANQTIHKIEPLVAALVERRAKISRLSSEMGPLLMDYRNNVGGTVPSEMTQDFETIERLLGQIQTYGCVVKDINTGLLDFLSLRNGREVYLCWRYGESKIEFYHELHTGFNGRRPL
ncbi:MAG: DUF2203 domain-containing protein [Chloroflexi bacterium]|nr:DUF2203 domain-containing protein [Chloroflexota bacterium]